MQVYHYRDSHKHTSIQTSEQYSNKVLSEFSGRMFSKIMKRLECTDSEVFVQHGPILNKYVDYSATDGGTTILFKTNQF